MIETAQEALLARQPICSKKNKTLGYELFYRKPGSNHAVVDDADSATKQVIANSFIELGLERIVGTALAFINVTRDFIVSDQCRSLPPQRVVFEILEDTIPDKELKDALVWLRKDGYHFALDDYDFSNQTEPLIPLCDFVKVDLQRVDRRLIQEKVGSLNNVSLLAEKVETLDDYDFCRNLGFDYFQGYYFCKPRIISGSRIPTNRIAVFRLLAKLRDPDVTSKELESIVSEDVSLSYKLLQYLNSAYLGMKKRIESIGHAVRLVGTDHLRLLSTLLMMTSMEDKPRILSVLSLNRAKMCELLAMRLGARDTDSFFTAGLFSTLDAFLDCTMKDALENLPLSEAIRRALVAHEGPLGEVLECVKSYENPNLDLKSLNLDPPSLQNAYTHSIYWSEDLLERFQD